MSIIDTHAAAVGAASTMAGVQIISVNDRLWRVVASDGRALGHVQSRDATAGERFAARRFHAASHAMRDVGEFWSAREAIECLRLSR